MEYLPWINFCEGQLSTCVIFCGGYQIPPPAWK